MPRKRVKEQPYDPISADLVREATVIQRRPNSAVPRVAIVPPVPPKAKPTITKRFVLSRSEDAELNAFLVRLQEAARTKVPLGLLVRAVLGVLMEREETLLAEARGETFRLPSTHDRLAQGEFEERWRSMIRSCATSAR
jgi:hypothetical protein